MARLFEEPVPETTEDKKRLLTRHHIALWDVVAACDIKGSSDRSIRNVIPTDLNRILRTAGIETIIANGDTAFQLYRKYCQEKQEGKPSNVHPPALPMHFSRWTVWPRHGAGSSSDKSEAGPGSKFLQTLQIPRFFLPKAYKTGMMEIHLNIIIKL